MRKAKSKNKLRKRLLVLIIILVTFILAITGYIAWTLLSDYIIARKAYSNISTAYTTTVTPSPVPTQSPVVAPTETTPLFSEYSPISVDFDALYAKNQDIVGWIYSPDTPIDYPVLRTNDNMTYLHTLMDGSYNASGSIFVDCGCYGDFSGRNTIVYGHNMNDGSMFASLRKYRSNGYYDAHPVMYLNTLTQNYKVEVFSAYITDPASYSYEFEFENDKAFEYYLNEVISMSDFKTDVEVSADDRIVTFSTCTYEHEDARYLVHGKLVPIG